MNESYFKIKWVLILVKSVWGFLLIVFKSLKKGIFFFFILEGRLGK